MKTTPIQRTVFLAVSLLAGWALEASAADALQVTHFRLGPTQIDRGNHLSTLLSRMNAYEGVSATERPAARGSRWDRLPENVKPAEWLSVTDTAFGKRLNLVALQFNEAGDATLCAWRQGLSSGQSTKYSYINTIPPGPDCTHSLAMIGLAVAVRQQQESAEMPTGPRVRLEVRPWENASEQLGGTAVLNMEAGGESGVGEPSGKQLEAVRHLLFAAVWQAGYRPTLGKASVTLEVEVALEVDRYSLRTVWRGTEGEKTLVKRQLDRTNLLPALTAVIKWVSLWGEPVSDVVQLAQRSLAPAAFVDDHLVFRSVEHSPAYPLVSVDSRSLLPRWRIAQPDRGAVQAAAFVADGETRVYHTEPALRRMTLTDGGAAGGRWPSPTREWGFQPFADDGMVVLTENVVRVSQGRSEWTAAALDVLDAGPLIAEGIVVAGGRHGVLKAWDLDAGKQRWTKTVGGRLFGPICRTNAGMVATTQGGDVICFAAGSGEIVWRHEFGDALVAAPWPYEDTVVLAGGRRVVVLAADDGRVLQQRRHPVAMHCAVPAPVERPSMAVVDTAGTVRFYDAGDLSVRGTVALGIRPGPGALLLNDAPVRWGVGGDFVDRAPLLLVPGYLGNAYLLSIP